MAFSFSFFFFFVGDVAEVVNYPKDSLAKSGYKQDMKIKKFKHPLYFWLHAGMQ
jgi:hypothetical protein